MHSLAVPVSIGNVERLIRFVDVGLDQVSKTTIECTRFTLDMLFVMADYASECKVLLSVVNYITKALAKTMLDASSSVFLTFQSS